MPSFKFQSREKIGQTGETARLGAGNSLAQRFNDKDVNKLVKLAGDSRFDTCATGDDIEARVLSVDTAIADGYSTGAVGRGPRFHVMLDGAQADGTGLIAVGDYVVAGPQAALGVAQEYPKVRKATTQATAKASPFAWRVIAVHGSATNNGAAGAIATIERVAAVVI